MVIMASCSVFYMQLYMLLMLGTNTDLYIAVSFPFWYRLHYRVKQTIPIIVFLVVICALYCAGIAVYSEGDLYTYYPTMFVSSLNSALAATTRYWPIMVVVLCSLTAPTLVVLVLCVVIFIKLRRLQQQRQLLGIVSVNCAPLPVAAANNSNSTNGSARRLETDGPQAHVQTRKPSGGSEDVELKTMRLSTSPQVQSASTAFLMIRANRNGSTPGRHTNLSGNSNAAESRKLLLMLFTFIRFAIVYLVIDTISFVLSALFTSDFAMIAQFSFMINGAGDAILYNLIIPRYREASKNLEIKLISKCCRFDIRNFKRIHRILKFGFKFL